MKSAFAVAGFVLCICAKKHGGSYGYGLALCGTLLLGLYALSQ